MYAASLATHRHLLGEARQLTLDLVDKTEVCRRSTEGLRREVADCTVVYEGEKKALVVEAAAKPSPSQAATPLQGFRLEPPTPSPYAAMIPSHPVTPASTVTTPIAPVRSEERRRIQDSVQREAKQTWTVRQDALSAQHSSAYGTPPTAVRQNSSPSMARPWRAPTAASSKTPLQELAVPPQPQRTPPSAHPTPTRKPRPVTSFMSKQEMKASSVMDKVADDIVAAVTGEKENFDAQYMLDPLEAIGIAGEDGFASRPKLATSPVGR